MRILRILILVSILTAAAFSATAYAYIPASAFLVKSFTAKHAAARAVRIRSTVTGIEPNSSTSVSFKKTMIYLPASHMVRLWISDDTGAVVYGSQMAVAQGSPLLALLFESRADIVAEKLRQSGIPVKAENELLRLETEDERRKVEVMRLDRFRSGSIGPVQAVWAIGKDQNQLWINKDSLMPLRLMTARRGGDSVVDYVMTGARYARDFTMPKQIEYLRSGEKLAFREDISDVTQDASASELSFSVPDGFSSSANIPSSTRNMIQAYADALK